MKLQDQLNEILNDLSLVGSETVLILGSILLLIVGLFSRSELLNKFVFVATIVVALYFNIQIEKGGIILSQSLFLSKEIISFGSLFLVFALTVLVFPRKTHVTEFYFFTLAITLGSIFMMKANSLLIIYLSIELVSFVSYILTSFSFKKKGHEAGIKYLLFGAISSAIMLIGLGLVYGTTQTFYISEWTTGMFSDLLPQIGVLFLIFGVLYKCAIFPFHIWTPAAYQEAPIDAVALFSVIPKLGGLILLKRIYFDAGFDFSHLLTQLLLVLGMATILVGTFGALKQVNTRRMISFGSVAHSGFLMGLVITPIDRFQEAFWWYAVSYGLMNYAVFYLISRYEALSIYSNKDYQSSTEAPWIGGIFTLILVSLVGIPPLAGFTAKLFLFSSLWEIFNDTAVTVSIAYLLVSVFATVASLFFYLRVPYNVFLSTNASNNTELSIVFSLRSKIIATIFGIALLMLFFAPKLVMSFQSLLNNVHE